MAGDDTADIIALLEARNAALRDGRAIDAVAPMADDAVVFDLAPPLVTKGAEARDAHAIEAWLKTWDGPVTNEMPDPDIQISGDMAVVTGLVHMTGNKKGEGRLDLWYRATTVLRRRAGHWRIVHEHSSFPMKMDGSNRVANDLRP